MKLRIYVDTSVVGGVYDPDFKEWSNKLIEEFRVGKNIVVISDLTLRELEEAPENVRKIIEEIPQESKEFVVLDDEAKKLARYYIDEGVVGERNLVDAQHIAIATINRVGVLVSWNFRQIVNLHKIRLYNAVNLKYGYPAIEIRTPREVVYDEERV